MLFLWSFAGLDLDELVDFIDLMDAWEARFLGTGGSAEMDSRFVKTKSLDADTLLYRSLEPDTVLDLWISSGE